MDSIFIKKIAIESLKEGLRIFLIATLPILVAQLEAHNFQWEILLYTGLIALIKAIDKGVHEWKMIEGGETAWKGIIGF